MRLSIRDQILVPILAIQAVAITTITLVTASIAAERSESEIVARLNGVVDALGHSNFPFTSSVLTKMRGLSGAHFFAYDESGHVLGTSFLELHDPPPNLPAIPLSGRLDSLGRSPTIRLDGVNYFAVALRSPGVPRESPLLVLYPETSLRQANRDASTPSVLLGGGSLVVMAGLTSWIAHRISVRIRRVEQQVARIAAGRFEEIDPGSQRDEVQDLTRSINSLCIQLRAMTETIRLSERTKLLSQLGAGLAHQLRNSLTGARMSIQLHARRYPPPAHDHSLEVAIRQLTMTEEQVKGLLTLGHAEPRALEIIDLESLLADLALLVAPASEHARVTLRCRRGEIPILVRADASGLRAAILNLTLNAIEAAGAQGYVELRALPEGDFATIEVVDSGPGPSSELGNLVFDPFVTSKPEGIGLGLALARQVSEEHGGRLSWARDGILTRFRLTLPRVLAKTDQEKAG